jgi:hypothetical protein
MNSQFKPEELVTKAGKRYPVVGGRLRVAHEDNDEIGISTELVSFEPCVQAIVKATVATHKGQFMAHGAATVSRDEHLSESLLELAETRAIARALRFCGYGVEFTGSEEVGDRPLRPLKPQSTDDNGDPASKPQIHAIEKIASSKHWNALECCRRILRGPELKSVDELSKDKARVVIDRMKQAA